MNTYIDFELNSDGTDKRKNKNKNLKYPSGVGREGRHVRGWEPLFYCTYDYLRNC